MMDLFKQGMKGPTRPAPAVPGIMVKRYSPITNWDNDPFGADVFEPLPHVQKKKLPPPRPPPPKINSHQVDIPAKPSHFIRKPTVLSSLLSRKSKTGNNENHNQQSILPEFSSEVDAHQMFPKCEPKNMQTGALIDLSSPPSSPTFTTRSSSDGLSVDSFGSDATTSTNHHNNHNGNSSQAESGFEDDFDIFLSMRKSKENTIDDFTAIDPFSPQVIIKPPIIKKPGLLDSSTSQPQVPLLKGPTIIRAKPVRPKPPDNSALLKNTFGSNIPVTMMNVNTTKPIQKVNSFGDNFDSKHLSWNDEGSPERESSPPMPTIPPPPPPLVTDDFESESWNGDELDCDRPKSDDDEEPYAIALFDYFTDHQDDLCFSSYFGFSFGGVNIDLRMPRSGVKHIIDYSRYSLYLQQSRQIVRREQFDQVNAKIKLIRRVDDEWLFGRLESGAQGNFPSNYVDIKIPLLNETRCYPSSLGVAVALYDFEPVQPGDLRFIAGDTVTVVYKLNEEWYFGECNGLKGQFPINYVQMS